MSHDIKDEDQSDSSDEAPACSWCHKRLLPEESERGHVCARCLRLLRDAGFSIEEIFGRTEEN